MDQDKAGLFNLLLQSAYEEAVQEDVVKIKRKKIVLRLQVLKDALEEKDFEKGNFILLDICDKILNDPYSDEYNMTTVQIDMVVFSSAVLNVCVKYYDRIQQIIMRLIIKYRNPIFYYVLGVSYFYKLSFRDAKEQFTVVINMLGNHKNVTFTWPDTSILIVTTTSDKIREDALCFLDLITLIQNVKPSTNKSKKKSKHTMIEITSTFQSNLDLNVGIGKFVQKEIYPRMQSVLADLMKFDKSKLPSDYQKIITRLYKPINKSIPETSTKEQKVADTSTVKQQEKTKKSKSTSLETVTNAAKDATLPKVADQNNGCTTSSEKTISKRNEWVQTQVSTKCKYAQTFIRTASQYIQTIQDDSELTEKNKLIMEQEETISNLKMKLNQLAQKQKENETKQNRNNSRSATELIEKNRLITEQQEIISGLKIQLNQLAQKLKEIDTKSISKDNDELIGKNRLIAEQQDVISSLKIKLNQSSSKQKELETKLNKSNVKINELSKTNKTILAETEKYKDSMAQLRNYNQILEKSSESVDKNKDEIKATCKTLFHRYKGIYYMQIQFYENFQKRCENVLSVLNNINHYLTEITVPTKEDCQNAVNEWFIANLSCTEILAECKNQYKKCDKLGSDELSIDLLHMPPMMPIKEPNDILLESVPLLIYTIKNFEMLFQSNYREKKNQTENVKKETIANNVNGETDYRKLCNFIHKDDQRATASTNENHSSTFDIPLPRPRSKNRTLPEGENLTPKSIEPSSSEGTSKKLQTLISYLKLKIPHRTEVEIMDALNSYRKKNNGSLSGMTLQYILYNVVTILETPQTAWSMVKSGYKDFENDNHDMCPICIEPIATKEKSVLTCGHVYHTECIREWLSRSRVCAVCRMYTVLDEDFPPLKT